MAARSGFDPALKARFGACLGFRRPGERQLLGLQLRSRLSALCLAGCAAAFAAGGCAVVPAGVRYSGCTPPFRVEASSQRLISAGNAQRSRWLTLMARWRVNPSATAVPSLLKR